MIVVVTARRRLPASRSAPTPRAIADSIKAVKLILLQIARPSSARRRPHRRSATRPRLLEFDE